MNQFMGKHTQCFDSTFDDGRNKTLKEIGEKFSLSQERIRQIEKKALRKLTEGVFPYKVM